VVVAALDTRTKAKLAQAKDELRKLYRCDVPLSYDTTRAWLTPSSDSPRLPAV